MEKVYEFVSYNLHGMNTSPFIDLFIIKIIQQYIEGLEDLLLQLTEVRNLAFLLICLYCYYLK